MSTSTAASASCCVFSTADDAYMPRALVSLLSFKERNPHYDAFILCSNVGEENRRLCETVGVVPLEIDLSREFYQQWRYPRECYYHFKGPDVFSALGYRYSVYVDGDTYCNGHFSTLPEQSFHIAGCSYDTVGEFFSSINDYEAIQRAFPSAEFRGFDRPRVQSGVLLYDNQALQELGYFAKTCDLYDACIRLQIPRKGDDSLLALLLGTTPQIATTLLPIESNLIDFLSHELIDARGPASVIARCVIYHFVDEKPWFSWSKERSQAHVHFRREWIKTMIRTFPTADARRCFRDLSDIAL